MLHPRRPSSLALLGLPFLLLGTGCSGSTHPVPVERPPLGGPLAGITSEELAAFRRGQLVFQRRFTPEEGLGPSYNATSCESCHSVPTVGGSAELYRNFYLGMTGTPGSQAPLYGLTSAVVPSFGGGAEFDLEAGRPVLPEALPGLVTLAQRNSLPLFGVGLFEFVSDATILAGADPNDADGDGISGRFNTDAGSIGRFGVKAQSNNIEVFTRAPLKNQLGITSDPFQGSRGIVSLGHALQVSADPNLPTVDPDSHADPEISRRDLGDLIAFTRFLAPPEPLEPMSAQAERGLALFAEIGCTGCHRPELPSSRGPVRAYTDLLLHDLGPELADGLHFGMPQASTLAPMTSAGEFRTQPLWGVSLSAPFLHDGRAETLREAIELHRGEATPMRDAFLAWTSEQQADLIAFLESL